MARPPLPAARADARLASQLGISPISHTCPQPASNGVRKSALRSAVARFPVAEGNNVGIENKLAETAQRPPANPAAELKQNNPTLFFPDKSIWPGSANSSSLDLCRAKPPSAAR